MPHQPEPSYTMPDKPETTEGQISVMWDVLANHIPHCFGELNARISWQNVKLNFILIILAIIAGMAGGSVALLLAHMF